MNKKSIGLLNLNINDFIDININNKVEKLNSNTFNDIFNNKNKPQIKDLNQIVEIMQKLFINKNTHNYDNNRRNKITREFESKDEMQSYLLNDEYIKITISTDFYVGLLGKINQFDICTPYTNIDKMFSRNQIYFNILMQKYIDVYILDEYTVYDFMTQHKHIYKEIVYQECFWYNNAINNNTINLFVNNINNFITTKNIDDLKEIKLNSIILYNYISCIKKSSYKKDTTHTPYSNYSNHINISNTFIKKKKKNPIYENHGIRENDIYSVERGQIKFNDITPDILNDSLINNMIFSSINILIDKHENIDQYYLDTLMFFILFMIMSRINRLESFIENHMKTFTQITKLLFKEYTKLYELVEVYDISLHKLYNLVKINIFLILICTNYSNEIIDLLNVVVDGEMMFLIKYKQLDYDYINETSTYFIDYISETHTHITYYEKINFLNHIHINASIVKKMEIFTCKNNKNNNKNDIYNTTNVHIYNTTNELIFKSNILKMENINVDIFEYNEKCNVSDNYMSDNQEPGDKIPIIYKSNKIFSMDTDKTYIKINNEITIKYVNENKYLTGILIEKNSSAEYLLCHNKWNSTDVEVYIDNDLIDDIQIYPFNVTNEYLMKNIT